MLHVLLKPHRETLRAQTGDVQKLFVLLKVIPAPALAQTRPPLALALVLDTSGSMNEAAGGRESRSGSSSARLSKLQHARRATEAVLQDERLVGEDLVCLVSFDDVARVALPLGPLGNGSAARATLQGLGGLGGSTQMALGLRAALEQLGRIRQGGVAQRVILLTDGQAADASACREIARELARQNATLVTVGIGDDYNEELLRDLAEIGRGRPHHLGQIERLEEVFGVEIQNTAREVVTGLHAQVQTVAGVKCEGITRVYPDLAEMEMLPNPGQPQTVGLGNVGAGDFTVFVLEFTVSGLSRGAGRARLAQLQLGGTRAASGENGDSNGSAPLDLAPIEIVVGFSPDEASAESVDEEVLGYVSQRNVDRLVQNAVRRSAGDPAATRRHLQSALEVTRRLNNGAVTRMLQQSLDELDQTGRLSPGMRKTIALESRTRTLKTQVADARHDAPDDDEIRRLTGA